jgi:hypothetical protein
MHGSGSFSCCTRRQRSFESQPLVSSVAPNPIHSRSAYCTMRLCVASKAAILVLLWNVFIGGIYCIGEECTFFVLIVIYSYYNVDISLSVVTFYSLAAIIYLLYPLSGFLADVYVGRFNSVFVSLTSFTCSVLACLLSIILCLLCTGIFRLILFLFICLCVFIALISIAGYKANSIQFGLDQLLEAPSQHHALFIHWAKWCYDFMSMIIIANTALIFCNFNVIDAFVFKILPLFVLLAIVLFFLVMLLILGCIKRHWFYSETRRQNPYRMVIKVLNFTGCWSCINFGCSNFRYYLFVYWFTYRT